MFLFFIFSVRFSMFSSCGRNHPLDDKRPHFLCSAQCALFPHVTDELRFQKLYLIMIFSVGLGPPSTSPSGFGLHLSLSIEAWAQEYTLDKIYLNFSTFSSSALQTGLNFDTGGKKIWHKETSDSNWIPLSPTLHLHRETPTSPLPKATRWSKRTKVDSHLVKMLQDDFGWPHAYNPKCLNSTLTSRRPGSPCMVFLTA